MKYEVGQKVNISIINLVEQDSDLTFVDLAGFCEESELYNDLGEVLQLAKPYLTVRYALGQDIKLKTAEEIYFMESKGFSPYHTNEEYIVIDCDGGHQYVRNITANSLAAIAEELFKFVASK